jgi:hypothetical protein
LPGMKKLEGQDFPFWGDGEEFWVWGPRLGVRVLIDGMARMLEMDPRNQYMALYQTLIWAYWWLLALSIYIHVLGPTLLYKRLNGQLCEWVELALELFTVAGSLFLWLQCSRPHHKNRPKIIYYVPTLYSVLYQRIH